MFASAHTTSTYFTSYDTSEIVSTYKNLNSTSTKEASWIKHLLEEPLRSSSSEEQNAALEKVFLNI